jgi:nitroreductase
MNAHEAIFARRSVRKYVSKPVPREAIEKLIVAAAAAPSASNSQTWAFGVVQDAAVLSDLDAKAKAHLLGKLDEMPLLAQYRPFLENPDYRLFYNAPALVVIYATPGGLSPEINCTLAAANFMLAACEMGLGTCWIGLAAFYLSERAVKEAFGVPKRFNAVAPLIVGYGDGPMPPPQKKPPNVVYWQA